MPVEVTAKNTSAGNEPSNAAVGVASGQVLARNEHRKGLICINTSAEWISLGLGVAAELYKGISLAPNGGAWNMQERDFTKEAITAIASGAASNLSIQEFE
jgi:hypothetical protein